MKLMVKFVAVFILAAIIGALALPASAGDERKVKNQVQPMYPELAKSMHLAGTVKVEITIDQQGNVKNAKIVGGHPVLADAAKKAIEKWRYEAGPEETRIVSFNFKED